MAKETSIGKLQCMVDKLSKENTKLKDKNANAIYEIKLLNKRVEKLTNNIKEKITKAVEKAIATFKDKQIEELEKENLLLKERIFKLEQRLNISSDTSSLPPSQDPIWHKDTKVYDARSQKKTNNKPGGQSHHPKHKLEKFKDNEVTEFVDHEEEECIECNSNDITIIGIKTRDELDFEVVVKKKRHQFFKYQCNCCGKIFTSPIPINLSAENQYGANTQALTLALLYFGDVSLRRTNQFFNGLTDNEINPSEGYLAKIPKRASKMLSDFIFDCEEEIVHSHTVNHDDGVIKIGKSNKDKADELDKLIEKANKDELTDVEKEKLKKEIKKNFKGVLRAYTNGDVKLYKAHTNKSIDTYMEDNILPRLSKDTTVVHDHNICNYNSSFNFLNAECNIHPIRKGRGVKANTGHEWPDKIANLLEGFNEKRDKLIEKKINSFSEEELNYLSSEYDKIIEDGSNEYESFEYKNIYKDEKNLLEFFKKNKEELLRWTKDFSVSFTNNICETMIRLVKAKMKISYCFKNINTARDYANIITYTETCYSYGVNRYHALIRLFEMNPYTLQELKDIKKHNKMRKF